MTISFVNSFDYNNEEKLEFPFLDSDHEVVLYWQSPKRQKIERGYKWSQGDKSITIEDSIPVEDGMQAGEWKLSHIYIINDDGYDNVEMLEIYDGTEEEQVMYGYYTSYYTDLSFGDFTVVGVNKTADNKAPTIKLNSLKLSKRYVKKNKKTQKVTFNVKVKDASTIEEVKCSWYIYNYENYFKRGCYTGDEHMMKYDAKTKSYKYTLKINTKDVRKKELCGIYVKDIYGNEKYYEADYDGYLPDREKRKLYNAFKRVVVFAK